jgi:hypothetical protein
MLKIAECVSEAYVHLATETDVHREEFARILEAKMPRAE